ncbi:beta-1,3-galactosyltransferase 1-like [Saccoglossus kowalevskii]|uniref:Hexosyltransferase n=1 Tax=Saccoglossus kowalevskii TaxID=10224 RepID=A0ABM0GWE6_SACKO|nr:PREDICTED: beta-1,3-galactosyltransferase 1-like [Saccoglossus kowalevskii]
MNKFPFVLLICCNVTVWFALYQRVKKPDSKYELVRDDGDTVNSTANVEKLRRELNRSLVFNETDEYTNLHDYELTLNHPHMCKDRKVFLLVLVTSKPESKTVRSAIRNTWANEVATRNRDIVILFLLGTPTNDSIQDNLIEENKLQGDILQENFVDDYLNLTLKTIMGLKWATQYCPNAKYVMKTDSDVFVNFESIVEFLATRPMTGYAVGHRFIASKPQRQKGSKWYTSEDVYPGPTYPPYLCGTGYIASIDVVTRLYLESIRTKLLHWEDVYVGIVMQQIQILPRHDNRFDTFSKLYKPQQPCSLYRLFTVHHVKTSGMYKLWKKFQKYKLPGKCHAYNELS